MAEQPPGFSRGTALDDLKRCVAASPEGSFIQAGRKAHEAINTVMHQSGCSHDDACDALMWSHGDIVEAIMRVTRDVYRDVAPRRRTSDPVIFMGVSSKTNSADGQ